MVALSGPKMRAIERALALLPVWILAYLCFHAYEQGAVRGGRDALLARLAATGHVRIEVCTVILPFVAYGVTAYRATGPVLPPGLDGIRRASGVLSLGLLSLHLADVWWPRVVLAAPTPAYVAMLSATATPLRALLQLAFVSATCVHLGLRVLPALTGLGVSLRGAAALSTLVCGALWLWFVDVLSAYVGGSPLL